MALKKDRIKRMNAALDESQDLQNVITRSETAITQETEAIRELEKSLERMDAHIQEQREVRLPLSKCYSADYPKNRSGENGPDP